VVSLGTSGTVFARHELPISDPTGVIASFADAAGGFLPLMCTLNAARVLSAAATMLGTDLAGLDQLALAGAPGAGGLTLLPYLDGERTPDLPSATGTLGGLTRANATPENLARAAVEGMLCNLAYGVDALRQEGVAVDRVLLIGGAAASWAVRAIAPQLFGVPVAVPVPGEYVGIGAARQAAWALASQDHAGAPLPQWEVSTETGAGASAWAGFGTAGTVDSGTAEQVRARYAELLAQVHGLG
jgi:xylulokinase